MLNKGSQTDKSIYNIQFTWNPHTEKQTFLCFSKSYSGSEEYRDGIGMGKIGN